MTAIQCDISPCIGDKVRLEVMALHEGFVVVEGNRGVFHIPADVQNLVEAGIRTGQGETGQFVLTLLKYKQTIKEIPSRDKSRKSYKMTLYLAGVQQTGGQQLKGVVGLDQPRGGVALQGIKHRVCILLGEVTDHRQVEERRTVVQRLLASGKIHSW